eukprot:s2860_g12.t1
MFDYRRVLYFICFNLFSCNPLAQLIPPSCTAMSEDIAHAKRRFQRLTLQALELAGVMQRGGSKVQQQGIWMQDPARPRATI